MIEIRNLSVSFNQQPVLDKLTIKFETGQVHGIIGLNGAGKTTFFNCLTGMVKPTGGEILLDDQPLKREHLGYLETNNYFYPNLTGRDYLNIFPKSSEKFNVSAFQKLLHLPLDELIETYSTGMKKKLALLAILQQEKPVYILDEPFNGLDLESNHILELIVSALRQKGKTQLITSHVLAPLLQICDQIHLLQNGNYLYSYSKKQFGSIRQDLFRNMEQQVESELLNVL